MGKRRVTDLFPDELKRMTVRFRIMRNIVIDPATSCWRWQGRINNGGYPIMAMRLPGFKHPRPMIASRVSLEVFKGPPALGLEAAHDPTTCPHTDCVNPDHLRWATRSENERDKRHPRRLAVREVAPAQHVVLGYAETADAPF